MGLRRAIIACIFSALASAATSAAPSGAWAATVSLAWDPNPPGENVIGYSVWLCAQGDPNTCELVTETAETTATVPLPAMGTGCWRAKARNAIGLQSDYSNEACVTVPSGIGPVVLSRTSVVQTPTGASIGLGWAQVAGAMAYRIAECPKGSANNCVQLVETVELDTEAVVAYGTHCWRGATVNMLGTMSAWGAELCVDLTRPGPVNAFRVVVYVPRTQ